MYEHKLSLVLLACGLLIAPGCSDDTDNPPGDGAVDVQRQDASVPEAAVSDTATDDVGPDAPAPDLLPPDAPLPDLLPPDAPVPDLPPPDAAVPDLALPDLTSTDLPPVLSDAAAAGPKTLYFTGSSSTALSAYRVYSDGTGKTLDTTLPATFDLYNMYVMGRREYADVNRDRPMPLQHVSTYYQPVHLPNKLGHLYQYITATPAGRGFFVVRPSGKVEDLAFVTGTTSSYTYTYYYYIGANKLGTIIAAAKAYSQSNAGVHLIRTDGKKWASTGTTVCDISPVAPAATLNYVYYYSFTFADNYFYFVGRNSTDTSYRLYRAPLDCSAAATEVTLPAVGTSTPTTIDYYLGLSEDGTKVFFVAGTSSTSEDVMVLDDATGTVTNVTHTAVQYYGPGYYYMYYGTSSSMVDLSPDNKYIAYVRYNGGTYELYLRPVNLSAPEVLLTDSTHFTSAAKYVYGLVWVNNDDLRFWVGSSSSYQDMFKYQPSTGTITQITTTGGTTVPYAGGATIHPYGGWYSPNGKYIYYTEYKSSSPSESNIRAIDRTTGNLIDITQGMYVYYGNSNIEAAETGGKVFFYAKALPSNVEDLYYFDQNAASTPVQLTSNVGSSSGYYYIYDIMPSSDGSKVAFSGGTSGSLLSVFVVETTTPPTVYQLTPTPTSSTYTTDFKMFSPDGKSLVYGTGSSSSALNLVIQDIGPSTTATTLELTTGYTSPAAVY